MLYQSESAAPSIVSGYGTISTDANGDPVMINDDGVVMPMAPRQKKNLLINGGFWFAQKQVPTAATGYTAPANGRTVLPDGWSFMTCSGPSATCNYTRGVVSAVAAENISASNQGTFARTGAASKLMIGQVVEGIETAIVRNSLVRFQFWARTTVGTFTGRMGLISSPPPNTIDAVSTTNFTSAEGGAGVDPTLASNLVYVTPYADITPDNATINGNGLDISITAASGINGWKRFGATFIVPNNALNIIPVIWSNSNASNAFNITQATLTDGPAIQTWAPKSIQQEFKRVQRFYQKSFPLNVAPAQNAGLAGAVRGHVSAAGATANQPIGFRLTERLRYAVAVPTTYFNPAAANAFVRNTTAGSDATALGAPGSNVDLYVESLFTGIAAWTICQAIAVHFVASREL